MQAGGTQAETIETAMYDSINTVAAAILSVAMLAGYSLAGLQHTA